MASAGRLQGRRILVVEDEFLVAQMLADLLEAAGAVVLGPLGRLEEALTFVEHNASVIDAVVLDVHVHGQASYPVADVLIDRGIQFVFTTGYDADALDPRYRAYPRCEKPVEAQALFAALTESGTAGAGKRPNTT